MSYEEKKCVLSNGIYKYVTIVKYETGLGLTKEILDLAKTGMDNNDLQIPWDKLYVHDIEDTKKLWQKAIKEVYKRRKNTN